MKCLSWWSGVSRWSKLEHYRLVSRCTRSCLHDRARHRLPASPARTRFAPSPTGYLHLGSLRTALFNYLLAKKTGGQFLLRLEDTDKKRTVADAELRLYEDLAWVGLSIDEGPSFDLTADGSRVPIYNGPFGPYRQSERTLIYQAHAEQLLQTPHAYRCFCSTERLNELAQHRAALGLPTDYDRRCASISKEEAAQRSAAGEPSVVRLKAPESYPPFYDLVYGLVGKAGRGQNAGVVHKHGEIVYEDPILIKSDGSPTYHFANVVDDHLMQITHVVRGTEWLSSTPKHLALYAAFGWAPPQFAHVGLLLDAEMQKLSKRKFDTEIRSFRDKGIIPSALVNFVALLGCSYEGTSDIRNMPEFVSQFDMKFTKGNTVVSFGKLDWLQARHSRLLFDPEFADQQDTLSTQSVHDEILDRLTIKAQQLLENGKSSSLVVVEPTQINKLRHYTASLLAIDALSFTNIETFIARHEYFLHDPPSLVDPEVIEDIKRFCDDNPEAFSHLNKIFAEIPATHSTDKSFTATNINAASQTLDEVLRRTAIKIHNICSEDERKEEMEQMEESKRKGHPLNQSYVSLCKILRKTLFAGHSGPSMHKALCLLGHDAASRRWETVTEKTRFG